MLKSFSLKIARAQDEFSPPLALPTSPSRDHSPQPRFPLNPQARQARSTTPEKLSRLGNGSSKPWKANAGLNKSI